MLETNVLKISLVLLVIQNWRSESNFLTVDARPLKRTQYKETGHELNESNSSKENPLSFNNLVTPGISHSSKTLEIDSITSSSNINNRIIPNTNTTNVKTYTQHNDTWPRHYSGKEDKDDIIIKYKKYLDRTTTDAIIFRIFMNNSTQQIKPNRRNNRAAINEAEDLAVLMQADSDKNKAKIEEMIASDFSTPEELDKDEVVGGISSFNKAFAESMAKIGDMMESLKNEQGDGLPKTRKAQKLKPVKKKPASKPKHHRTHHGLTFIESSWGPWGQWSKCTAKCNEAGFRLRRRMCDTLPDVPCDGNNIDITDCTVETSCKAEWQPWSDWGPCSVTCGAGVKARSRLCTTQEAGKKCKGKSSDFHTCHMQPCTLHDTENLTAVALAPAGSVGILPHSDASHLSAISPVIAGAAASRAVSKKGEKHQFSEWSRWSRCSNSCGKGTKRRSRKCNDLTKSSPLRVNVKHCGGGLTLQSRPCTGQCHAAPVAAGSVGAGAAVGVAAAGFDVNGGGGGFVDDAGGGDTAEYQVIHETSQQSDTGHSTADSNHGEEEDDDSFLTPETIIFITLILFAVILFILALCVWMMQRSYATKVKSEIRSLQPFYKSSTANLDDRPPGGGGNGVRIRQVYNHDENNDHRDFDEDFMIPANFDAKYLESILAKHRQEQEKDTPNIISENNSGDVNPDDENKEPSAEIVGGEGIPYLENESDDETADFDNSDDPDMYVDDLFSHYDDVEELENADSPDEDAPPVKKKHKHHRSQKSKKKQDAASDTDIVVKRRLSLQHSYSPVLKQSPESKRSQENKQSPEHSTEPKPPSEKEHSQETKEPPEESHSQETKEPPEESHSQEKKVKHSIMSHFKRPGERKPSTLSLQQTSNLTEKELAELLYKRVGIKGDVESLLRSIHSQKVRQASSARKSKRHKVKAFGRRDYNLATLSKVVGKDNPQITHAAGLQRERSLLRVASHQSLKQHRHSKIRTSTSSVIHRRESRAKGRTLTFSSMDSRGKTFANQERERKKSKRLTAKSRHKRDTRPLEIVPLTDCDVEESGSCVSSSPLYVSLSRSGDAAVTCKTEKSPKWFRVLLRNTDKTLDNIEYDIEKSFKTLLKSPNCYNSLSQSSVLGEESENLTISKQRDKDSGENATDKTHSLDTQTTCIVNYDAGKSKYDFQDKNTKDKRTHRKKKKSRSKKSREHQCRPINVLNPLLAGKDYNEKKNEILRLMAATSRQNDAAIKSTYDNEGLKEILSKIEMSKRCDPSSQMPKRDDHSSGKRDNKEFKVRKDSTPTLRESSDIETDRQGRDDLSPFAKIWKEELNKIKMKFKDEEALIENNEEETTNSNDNVEISEQNVIDNERSERDGSLTSAPSFSTEYCNEFPLLRETDVVVKTQTKQSNKKCQEKVENNAFKQMFTNQINAFSKSSYPKHTGYAKLFLQPQQQLKDNKSLQSSWQSSRGHTTINALPCKSKLSKIAISEKKRRSSEFSESMQTFLEGACREMKMAILPGLVVVGDECQPEEWEELGGISRHSPHSESFGTTMTSIDLDESFVSACSNDSHITCKFASVTDSLSNAPSNIFQDAEIRTIKSPTAKYFSEDADGQLKTNDSTEDIVYCDTDRYRTPRSESKKPSAIVTSSKIFVTVTDEEDSEKADTMFSCPSDNIISSTDGQHTTISSQDSLYSIQSLETFELLADTNANKDEDYNFIPKTSLTVKKTIERSVSLKEMTYKIHTDLNQGGYSVSTCKKSMDLEDETVPLRERVSRNTNLGSNDPMVSTKSDSSHETTLAQAAEFSCKPSKAVISLTDTFIADKERMYTAVSSKQSSYSDFEQSGIDDEPVFVRDRRSRKAIPALNDKMVLTKSDSSEYSPEATLAKTAEFSCERSNAVVSLTDTFIPDKEHMHSAVSSKQHSCVEFEQSPKLQSSSLLSSKTVMVNDFVTPPLPLKSHIKDVVSEFITSSTFPKSPKGEMTTFVTPLPLTKSHKNQRDDFTPYTYLPKSHKKDIDNFNPSFPPSKSPENDTTHDLSTLLLLRKSPQNDVASYSPPPPSSKQSEKDMTNIVQPYSLPQPHKKNITNLTPPTPLPKPRKKDMSCFDVHPPIPKALKRDTISLVPPSSHPKSPEKNFVIFVPSILTPPSPPPPPPKSHEKDNITCDFATPTPPHPPPKQQQQRTELSVDWMETPELSGCRSDWQQDLTWSPLSLVGSGDFSFSPEGAGSFPSPFDANIDGESYGTKSIVSINTVVTPKRDTKKKLGETFVFPGWSS